MLRNRTTWAAAAGLLVAAVLGTLSASGGEPLPGAMSGSVIVFAVVAVVAWAVMTLAGIPRRRPAVPAPAEEAEVMPGQGDDTTQAVR